MRDPYKRGAYSLAEIRAYGRRERVKFLFVGGILIAIALAALAVFIVRGGY